MRLAIIIILTSFTFSVCGQSDTIVWQKLSHLPDSSLSACQMGYFLIDSDFYVAGGWRGAPSGIPTNVVWKYHIPSDQWSRLDNLPFGAATSCSFALKGKGYFLTARDSISNGNCDKIFWEYDPAGDSWAARASFPDSPRQQSSCFVYGGKGYVGQTYGCVNWDTHFWQYDPIFDQWSQVAPLPTDIAAGSIAVSILPADTYLFGGEDIGGNILKDIWRYNIVSNQWDSVGQMPGLGRFFGVFWGFDSVIIGGGGTDGSTFSNDFYLYNFSSNTWSSIVFQGFTDSAYYGAAFVWGKTAYYFGGPTDLLQTTHDIGIWSADVSKYIHDTTTGIVNINTELSFSVYPNPSHSPSFSISTSESGDVTFYDALGRVIDERKLKQGVNQIRLTTDDEVVFYHATLQYGATANGKVVFLR